MRTEIRGRIREILLDLYRLEDELAELAERLIRKNSWLSSRYHFNLHAAMEAVRSDCIHDAIHTLRHAVRQSEESISREWAELEGIQREEGGISFLQEKNRHNAERKETPPC